MPSLVRISHKDLIDLENSQKLLTNLLSDHRLPLSSPLCRRRGPAGDHTAGSSFHNQQPMPL